jgi:hypothetical protein
VIEKIVDVYRHAEACCDPFSKLFEGMNINSHHSDATMAGGTRPGLNLFW